MTTTDESGYVGEPPALIDMTADEAREITEAIKATVERAWTLIVDAFHRRAWLALGYPTWDVYCVKEFDAAPLAMPREDRPEMVRSLRQAGLSQRAIASATGASQPTISRDLGELIHDESVPMPDKVIGLDGKKRPAQQPKPDVPQPQLVESDSDADTAKDEGADDDWEEGPNIFALPEVLPTVADTIALGKAVEAVRVALDKVLTNAYDDDDLDKALPGDMIIVDGVGDVPRWCIDFLEGRAIASIIQPMADVAATMTQITDLWRSAQ